jgi:hypothetical protein
MGIATKDIWKHPATFFVLNPQNSKHQASVLFVQLAAENCVSHTAALAIF